MEVRHLGLVEYQAALDLQKDLVEQRKQGLIPDQLLLLEHPPVITLGARNHRSRSNVLETPEALAQQGVGLYETGRGGDVTYHGPGQLVGYPIIELPKDRRDVHRYVRDLEEALICAVAQKTQRLRLQQQLGPAAEGMDFLGFSDLDDLTAGLQPSNLIIVATRPSMGKALALDTPIATPTGWTTVLA